MVTVLDLVEVYRPGGRVETKHVVASVACFCHSVAK